VQVRVWAYAALAVLFTGVAAGVPSLQRKAPQTKPATYADIHAQQSLGRVIVAPDGKFFLFEWGKPYLNWVPDTDWMAPSAARRLETTLFRLDVIDDYQPKAQLIFPPNGGATYWLGDLSPDSQKVVFFELDHDDHNVRAGVWDFQAQRRTWFKLRPDEGALGGVTPWISADEFLYPVKEGSKRARANFKSGDAVLCTECTAAMIRNAEAAAVKAHADAKAAAARIDRSDVPKDAILLAGAANGSIAVYARDNAETLSMMFKWPPYPMLVLFDNPRQWPRPAPKPEAKPKP
jgi:hypothetical protein